MIQQTKTRPQETLEFKTNKQLETFSFSPATNIIGEGKWLLAVTSIETTNSVLNITDENNSFSNTTHSHWNSASAEKTFDELKKIIRP